ncbi:MAG TPA: PGPGW domain-containing protein [Candidatus Thermoplasmatota archaeon]
MLRIVLAFILLTVGAVFVITPFVPGWPVMVVGLTILAAEYAWARRLLQRMRRGGKRKPVPPTRGAPASNLPAIGTPTGPNESSNVRSGRV